MGLEWGAGLWCGCNSKLISTCITQRAAHSDARLFFELFEQGLTADHTHQEEQYDRAHDCNHDALKVEARDARCAELIKEPTPDPRADDANHDVGNGSHLSVPSHDHARDPACEGSEDDPY
jgi:hypothetical protein